MQITINADGLKERTHGIEFPPRKNEIVRLKGNVYNVVEVIWHQSDNDSIIE